MSRTVRKTARNSRRGAVIALPAELGIEQLQALHAELAARVGDAAAVTVDGAAVARAHGAALQLLGLFWRERQNAQLQTLWQAPSEALRGAAAVLGLTRMINLSPELA